LLKKKDYKNKIRTMALLLVRVWIAWWVAGGLSTRAYMWK